MAQPTSATIAAASSPSDAHGGPRSPSGGSNDVMSRPETQTMDLHDGASFNIKLNLGLGTLRRNNDNRTPTGRRRSSHRSDGIQNFPKRSISGHSSTSSSSCSVSTITKRAIILAIACELVSHLMSFSSELMMMDRGAHQTTCRNQRCLPILGLAPWIQQKIIVTCSAEQIKQPPQGANKELRTKSTSEIIADAETSSSLVNSSTTRLPTTQNQSVSLSLHPENLTANDTTNKHYPSSQQQQSNLFCNSRCNCVILELGQSSKGNNSQGAPPGEWPANERRPPSLAELALKQLADDYSQDSEETPAAGSGPWDLEAGDQLSVQQQQQQQQLANGTRRPLAPIFGQQAYGQMRGESSGPQLFAQSLYSSQAPKLSFHAHAPYLKSAGETGAENLLPGQQSSGAHLHLRQGYLAGSHHVRAQRTNQLASGPIQRLIPLRSLDLGGKLAGPISASLSFQESSQQPQGNVSVGGHQPSASNSSIGQEHDVAPELVASLSQLLVDIRQQGVQALRLRNNSIQFELWSELYALLSFSLRQDLYQLDLSHNSLMKLGVTFTGYMEHHVAVHGSWPFNANQSYPASSPGKRQTQLARMRHSLLNGGKLFALVRESLAHQPSSIKQEFTWLIGTSNQTSANGGNQTSSQHISNGILQQPMSLRALDLSHNKLRWLINDQFRALKHVQSIRIDFNKIRYINQHAFSGLESLKYLNLNSNRLQVIYVEQFQTNYNLQALVLRSNYLAYLRGGSFASLVNLRRLDLSRNKLTILSNNAFLGLESLEHLNCSSNQFVHVPSTSMHPLTSLRQLDLSDNLAARLAPGAFFHLPIEELWLERNEQLLAIERGAFWDLPYLRRLSLRQNPMLISVEPQAFVGSQSLQQIDVDGCQSLEPESKQLLENITMLATSRLLRYEQLRGQQANRTLSGNSSSSFSAGQWMLDEPIKSVIDGQGLAGSMQLNGSSPLQIQLGHLLQPIAQQQHQPKQSPSKNTMILRRALETQSGGPIKFAYCMGLLALLVLAMKLTFRYTSGSQLMEARRRRRRVHETQGSAQRVPGHQLDLEGCNSSSLSISSLELEAGDESSASYPMCVQPDELVIPALSRQLRAARQEAYRLTEEPDQQPVGPSGDISVISEAALALAGCCQHQDQSQQSSHQLEFESTGQTGAEWPLAVEDHPCCADGQVNVASTADEQTSDQSEQPPQASAIDLIHSQLVAAGFDYGHANCAHFYQSLGPALQLADMTANYVARMDYY